LRRPCNVDIVILNSPARDAGVIKLIARPMLHTFFPEIAHIEQPLSGEVCARRQVWEILLKRDDGSDSIPNG